MRKDKLLELIEKYQKLENKLHTFWKDKPKYWIENQGLTDEGWIKHRRIEREQNEILGELDIPRFYGEGDLTHWVLRAIKDKIETDKWEMME